MRLFSTFTRGLFATLALVSASALRAADTPAPTPCTAHAGTISIAFDAGCLVNGVATVTAVPGGDVVVPNGFQLVYLLSETNGLIIQQVSSSPSFVVSSQDIQRIHPLVYDPTALDLALYTGGDASVYDLYNAISDGLCAAVNVNGAPFKVKDCPPPCTADAGSIGIDFDAGCLVNGVATVTAVPGGDAVLPNGFQLVYLLSETNGLIIQQVSSSPSFVVSSQDIQRIHPLVYDPNTLDLALYTGGDASVYDIYALISDGLCAAVNVSGAPFKVKPCDPGCTAAAGSISSNNPDICLTDGSAQLSATPAGGLTVPAGYNVLYVLTSGTGLVIQAVSTDPVFTVSSAGLFTIHTLVYDPTTLDLDNVVPGVTTGFDVNALLQQGGGSICASLDVAGAEFQVADCGPPPCTADAGTITPATNSTCLEEEGTVITASPDLNTVVPIGYDVLYVLSNGLGQTIMATSSTPEFTVTLPGLYTIHTLVYDPGTFDLSLIQPGAVGWSVESALVEGGGSICASWDQYGAITWVDEAIAGSLVADQPDLCLTDGSATLTATVVEQASFGGFPVIHLLSSGADLLLLEASGTPTFTVTAPGLYTIHTLAYDPATLDLSSVVFGETTGFEVNALLIQGGGTICAALDVAGAEFQVADCTPNCTANAGASAAVVVCSDGANFPLLPLLGPDAQSGGSWTGPNGQPASGIITPGVNASGTYVYFVGDVEGCPGDTAQVFLNVVAAPDAGSNAQLTICSSDPVFSCLAVLGGSPDPNGTWTGPNGALFNGEFDPATDIPGVYTYTVAGTPPCANATSTLVIVVQNCCTAGTDADTTVCFTDAPFALFGLLGGTPCPGGTWLEPNNNPHGNFFVPGSDLSGVYTYVVTATDGTLDSATVTVNVIECPNACEADAGSLTAEQNGPVCLMDGLALISATPDGNAVVPAGYSVAYVLTRGPELFIQNIEPDPSFEWPLTGDYTIHTLVYDPNTLDLSFVQFDVTTGFDINALLIQGGGNICASLDVAGAAFTIIQCAPPCEADAGIGGDRLLCFNDPAVDLFTLLEGTPDAGGSWTDPNGAAFSGIFDPSTDPQGVYVYTAFTGADCPSDTTQLFISLIECGGQLQLNARDAGTFQAQGMSTGVGTQPGALALSAWPNPGSDRITVRGIGRWSSALRMDVLDAAGKRATVPVTFTDGGAVLDVRTLAPGCYLLRVTEGTRTAAMRFVRDGN